MPNTITKTNLTVGTAAVRMAVKFSDAEKDHTGQQSSRHCNEGRTSTAELIRQVLRQDPRSHRTRGKVSVGKGATATGGAAATSAAATVHAPYSIRLDGLLVGFDVSEKSINVLTIEPDISAVC